jgi:hypothetical protein
MTSQQERSGTIEMGELEAYPSRRRMLYAGSRRIVAALAHGRMPDMVGRHIVRRRKEPAAVNGAAYGIFVLIVALWHSA